MPVVQLRVLGVPFDVQYVFFTGSLKGSVDFTRVAINEIRRLDAKSAIALSAIVDSIALKDALSAIKGGRDKFVILCSSVRTWANRALILL